MFGSSIVDVKEMYGPGMTSLRKSLGFSASFPASDSQASLAQTSGSLQTGYHLPL